MEIWQKITVAIIIFAILGFVFFSKPLSNGNGSDALDIIRETGKIDVCYVSYPPFSSKNLQTGKMEGLSVEIMESIAEKMNVKTNYIETSWSNIVLDLKSKRCQVNISGIFALVERAYGGLMYSEPYAYLGNNAVVKEGDNRFTSLEGLNNSNVTVAVQEGEASHLFAKKYLPNAKIRAIPSTNSALIFVEVKAGRADAALNDEVVIELYMRENKGFQKLLKKPFLVRESTFAMNEDDLKFINFMDNAINVLKASGEMGEIFQKYKYNSIIEAT